MHRLHASIPPAGHGAPLCSLCTVAAPWLQEGPGWMRAGSHHISGWFMGPFASAGTCRRASKCQSWVRGGRQEEQVGCVDLRGPTNSQAIN